MDVDPVEVELDANLPVQLNDEEFIWQHYVNCVEPTAEWTQMRDNLAQHMKPIWPLMSRNVCGAGKMELRRAGKSAMKYKFDHDIVAIQVIIRSYGSATEADRIILDTLISLKKETCWSDNNFPHWFMMTLVDQLKNKLGVTASEEDVSKRVEFFHKRYRVFKGVVGVNRGHWDQVKKRDDASDEL
ncbi:hypothetical protein SASPL_101661 [Salvia splendens]|uniref:Uncharacterized protein n=1 Tax=Salvia splendens TaxID=180675 RepID=A0A8X8YR83_SALSN|nr:hypothetical protein SASPL_101661 [Salvia splendens]